MSRTTTILLAVLGVVIVGGGVYWWLNKDNFSLPGISNSTNSTNTTNTAVSNSNTSTANLNLATTDDQKGDKALDASLTVAGTTVHVSSSSMAETFQGLAAPKNNAFVVIYFDGIAGDKIAAVNQALKTDAHLLVGSTVVPLTGIKVAGTIIKNDRGYLKFVVASSAKHLTLEVGSGTDAQRVTLAY